MCAQDFWYFLRHIKTQDEDQKKLRPFPVNYEYLQKFNKQIEDDRRIILLKSRRLLASWIGVLRQLWQAKFSGTTIPGSHDVFRGGIMSVGQTEAEYLIQRISRAHSNLPEWIKRRNPLTKDNVMYLEFERGGTIQAFPLKREGPQTFGFSEVFFDEMALQEAVRTVWTGLMPTLGADGILIAVSTPNGKQNLFYDIWSNKNNQYNSIKRIKMHWTENPEHDEAWFRAATGEMDQQMIARMFELSFAAYYGQPVWGDVWNPKMHVAEETDVSETKPMYIGWDFGFHFPAVVFVQRNGKDQFVGHREYIDYDISFHKFCADAAKFASSFYDRKKVPEIHCVPPDANMRYRSRAITGATNDASQIKMTWGRGSTPAQVRIGPGEVGTRNNEGPRLKEVRQALSMRKDGEPGAYFNERMVNFIEGGGGGYCYPEKGGEEPEKNEYGHVQDAYQAAVVVHNRLVSPIARGMQDRKVRRRIGWRIGL